MKQLSLCLLSLLLSSAYAQGTKFDLALSTKMLAEHSEFKDRPFGDEDVAYGLFAEIREGAGLWRLGAHYASGLSDKEDGTMGADTVITPEISLLGSDGMWKSGFGILMDYVDTGEETDWGDLYFQFQLGADFSVTRNSKIGIHGYYAFEDLGSVFDFDTGDLDFGLDFTLRF